jgi:hypothetical protein
LEVSAEIAAMLADPDVLAELAAIPGDASPSHVVTLLASADRASASATLLTGTVEAGLSAASARAIVGRARDLREDYSCVAERWLSGALTGDAVREGTVGVRTALKHSGLPAGQRDVARKTTLDVVLPVAERGTVADVKRVISHLTLVTNPDGASQAAMDAFDDQSLSVEQVGSMVMLTAYLTPEPAAAMTTVLTQLVGKRRRAGDLEPRNGSPTVWAPRPGTGAVKQTPATTTCSPSRSVRPSRACWTTTTSGRTTASRPT